MKDVIRLFRQGFDFKSETGSKDVIRWFAFLIITSIIFIGALFVLFFIINEESTIDVSIISPITMIWLVFFAKPDSKETSLLQLDTVSTATAITDSHIALKTFLFIVILIFIINNYF